MEFTVITDVESFPLPDTCVIVKIADLPEGDVKEDALAMSDDLESMSYRVAKHVVLLKNDAERMGLR